MLGIKRLPRKEKTAYKPSDLWTAKEHEVFLRYCPSKRDRCYHAMAVDTSARPHELLNLRIGDVKFSKTDIGVEIAQIVIVGGKTKSRILSITDSIPYFKDWLAEHPQKDNPDAWLFVVADRTAKSGQKLSRDGLWDRYTEYYKTKFFPKLLDDPTIPDTDKAVIKGMLSKKWNLYVQRHGALTLKSQYLSEHVLRDHAGWTVTSKMPALYLHYFGAESANIIVEQRGIATKKQTKTTAIESRICPNCKKWNKPYEKVCTECKLVMSLDGYVQVMNKDLQLQQKEKEIEEMKKLLEKMQSNQKAEIQEMVKAILKEQIQRIGMNNLLNNDVSCRSTLE